MRGFVCMIQTMKLLIRKQIGPVSYTHLDVYKRQVKYMRQEMQQKVLNRR